MHISLQLRLPQHTQIQPSERCYMIYMYCAYMYIYNLHGKLVYSTLRIQAHITIHKTYIQLSIYTRHTYIHVQLSHYTRARHQMPALRTGGSGFIQMYPVLGKCSQSISHPRGMWVTHTLQACVLYIYLQRNMV